MWKFMTSSSGVHIRVQHHGIDKSQQCYHQHIKTVEVLLLVRMEYGKQNQYAYICNLQGKKEH